MTHKKVRLAYKSNVKFQQRKKIAIQYKKNKEGRVMLTAQSTLLLIKHLTLASHRNRQVRNVSDCMRIYQAFHLKIILIH